MRERPFESTWDTRFFFRGAEHEEALQRLHYLVEEQTMNAGLLSGVVGCGKTLTRSMFAGGLDRGRFCVAVVENSAFPLEQLCSLILPQIMVDPVKVGSTFEALQLMQSVAERIWRDGRHLVLILDEAQDLPEETLKELRWLTNLNGGGRALLSLILVGQPELRGLVRRFPPLDQRISLRFHLPPLPREDVLGYLAHRCRVAGHPDGEIFAPETRDPIWLASGGIPRQINRLAKLALEHSWVKGCREILPDSIEVVIRDLLRQEAPALL